MANYNSDNFLVAILANDTRFIDFRADENSLSIFTWFRKFGSGEKQIDRDRSILLDVDSVVTMKDHLADIKTNYNLLVGGSPVKYELDLNGCYKLTIRDDVRCVGIRRYRPIRKADEIVFVPSYPGIGLRLKEFDRLLKHFEMIFTTMNIE